MKAWMSVAVIALALVSFADATVGGASPAKTSAEEITCKGEYHGHLQGVATDGRSLFWSFTVRLVKTDLSGRVLASVAVPNHHGDLCVKDGVVYVAVNLGRFNYENLGVSEVRAYAAKNLADAGRWKLPMCVHGAGGLTFADDRFFVVGGLPATHESNYVYEFTSDFAFVKRHELKTGFTLMGIQTACYDEGRFVFGIYGCKGDPPGSLECPRDLSAFVRRLGSEDVGILKLDGDYWTGRTESRKNGLNVGCIRRVRGYPACEQVYQPKPTGKGAVRLFVGPGHVTSSWKDSGYRLQPDGYRPLCCADPSCGVFFDKAKLETPGILVPAVEIGGGRAYSAPDLIRAVRRVAETDEAFAVHVVAASSDEIDKDRNLSLTIRAVCAEADKLGVRVIR